MKSTAFFVETVERHRRSISGIIIPAGISCYYTLRRYAGPKDYLGEDLLFFRIKESHYRRLIKFMRKEADSRRAGFIRYERKVKRLGNTALKKSGLFDQWGIKQE